MGLRSSAALAALACSLLVAGCGQSSEAADLATAKAIRDATASATTQAGLTDPWSARQQFLKDVEAALAANPGCANNACVEAPTLVAASQFQRELAYQALKAGPGPDVAVGPLALLAKAPSGSLLQANWSQVFSVPPRDLDVSLVKAAAQRLVDHVDSESAGTSASRERLIVAGDLLAGGDFVLKDTYRAVGLYAKAWAGGDPAAAGHASAALLGVADLRNGYLWNVRCGADCKRALPSDGVPDAGLLERQLRPAAIAQAQAAAANPTIVTLEFEAPGADKP